MSTPRKPLRARRRVASNIKTNSGKSISVHQSISDRWKSKRFARSTRKAEYLSTLPKEPWKRVLYRLHPKRVIKYWFSREGGIMALKLVGIGIVAMFILIASLFAFYRKDLPNVKDISGSKVGGSNTYYDRTGQVLLWQDYNATKRIGVTGDQISPYMKQATVAIEDKDFYKHGAFDVRGIIRAGVNDVFGSGGTQGGSTLTQQLVKNDNNWTYDHSINRKLKEIILAVELERDYSKDDILTGYLNVAPYGNVDRGVEAASQDYFGKSSKNLSLAEASMLASIPKAPTAYSPYSDPKYNPAATANYFDEESLIGRQHYVLDQMVKQKMITQDQADAAKKVDVLAEVRPLQNKYDNIKAPYFVLAAKQDVQNRLGEAAVDLGGLKIVTTVDMSLQTKAEQLVASNAASVKKLTAGLADDQATVAEDVQTGQIVALVGGENTADYATSTNGYAQLNFATRKVSPGSSFKPYDYVTMIDNNNNVGAGSVLYDNDTKLPANGYECTRSGLPPPKGTGNCLKDYDFLQPGPITLRYALGGSRNVPAVKAMLSAVPNDTSTEKTNSINKVISTASAMMDNPYLKNGEKTYNCYSQSVEEVDKATDADRVQCGASAAIGDGAYLALDDHVNGLSTLGRLGSAIPRTYILSVTNSANKSIYKWTQPKGTQAVKADSAYIVDNMASDPNASYLPGSCTTNGCTSYKFHRYQGWDFAIKTGTTNFGFDGLMASWSTKYAVVSWVGNHTRNVDITKLTGTSMEYLTEPLTRGMMEAAHNGQKAVNWTQPSDIKTLPAFVQRAHIHYGDVEPGPTNDIFPSWYAGGSSKPATSVTLDKVSGKVATSCTPALAKNSQTNANAASWNADIFAGGVANISGSTGTSKTGTSTVAQATDDVHNCNDSPPTVTVTAPGSCSASDNGGQGCQVVVVASQGTNALSGGSYTTAPAGTVSVAINGQVINNQAIPAGSGSPYQYSFYYKPGSSGTVTMTATVVDSVLYSGTATSNEISGTLTTGNPITGATATHGATKTTFSWTGGGGTYTVTQGNNILCSATAPSTTCTAPNSGVTSGSFTVTDSDNDTPASGTI